EPKPKIALHPLHHLAGVALEIAILADQTRSALRRQHQPEVPLVVRGPIPQSIVRIVEPVVAAIIEVSALALARGAIAFEVACMRHQPPAAATTAASNTVFAEAHLRHHALPVVTRQRPLHAGARQPRT